MKKVLPLSILYEKIRKEAPRGGAVRILYNRKLDQLEYTVQKVKEIAEHCYPYTKKEREFAGIEERFFQGMEKISGERALSSGLGILLVKTTSDPVKLYLDKVELTQTHKDKHWVIVKDLPLKLHNITIEFSANDYKIDICCPTGYFQLNPQFFFKWDFYRPSFIDYDESVYDLVSEYMIESN